MNHEDACTCTECLQRRLIKELMGELRIIRNEVRKLKAWAGRKQAEENAAGWKADSGRPA